MSNSLFVSIGVLTPVGLSDVPVVQWIERQPPKLKVTGSSPVGDAFYCLDDIVAEAVLSPSQSLTRIKRISDSRVRLDILSAPICSTSALLMEPSFSRPNEGTSSQIAQTLSLSS